MLPIYLDFIRETIRREVLGSQQFGNISSNWRIGLNREGVNKNSDALHITIYSTGSWDKPNPKFLLDFPTLQIRVTADYKSQGQLALKVLQKIKDVLLGIFSVDYPAPTPAVSQKTKYPYFTSADRNWGNEAVTNPVLIRVVSITINSDIMTLGMDESERLIYVANFNSIVEPYPEYDPNTGIVLLNQNRISLN